MCRAQDKGESRIQIMRITQTKRGAGGGGAESAAKRRLPKRRWEGDFGRRTSKKMPSMGELKIIF